MTQYDFTPPEKIPPTLPEVRVNAIAGAVCAGFFAVAAILCWHFHVPGLVTGLLLIITFFSLVVLVDALQTRRKIIHGIPLFKSRPVDRHSGYAMMTVTIIALAIFDIAATLYVLWHLHQHSYLRARIVFGVMLAICWGIWIGFYRLSMSKSFLVWSHRPDSGSAEASSPRFDLPPLTRRGIKGPVLSIVGQMFLMGCALAFVNFSSPGHTHLAYILRWIALYFAAGVVLAIVYVALVVFLTWQNNKDSQRRGAPIPVSSEVTGPPRNGDG